MGEIFRQSGQRQTAAVQRPDPPPPTLSGQVRPLSPSDAEGTLVPLGPRSHLGGGDVPKGEAPSWEWAGCGPSRSRDIFQDLWPPGWCFLNSSLPIHSHRRSLPPSSLLSITGMLWGRRFHTSGRPPSRVTSCLSPTSQSLILLTCPRRRATH